MITPKLPKYDWGQRVRAVDDLINDGSFAGAPDDAVLVPKGTEGEVIRVGSHTETNNVVYLVEFSETMVLGCFEEEIVAL